MFPTFVPLNGVGNIQGLFCKSFQSSILLMVPPEGLEPPLRCQKQILSLPRLPIPPWGRTSAKRAHYSHGPQGVNQHR